MPWLSPRERRERRRRWIFIGLAAVVGFMVLSAVERGLVPLLRVDGTGTEAPAFEGRDWYRLLRVAGYLPTWIALAIALALHDRARGAARWADRGWMVLGSSALAGLAAEVLKVVVRRHRPGIDAEFRFDWFGRGVEGLGLGMPSSHAAVAFGGAFMLARLAPWSGPVVLAWAGGCALTRLLTGAHFVSDVAVAAAIGYAAAAGIGRLADPGRPGA